MVEWMLRVGRLFDTDGLSTTDRARDLVQARRGSRATMGAACCSGPTSTLACTDSVGRYPTMDQNF